MLFLMILIISIALLCMGHKITLSFYYFKKEKFQGYKNSLVYNSHNYNINYMYRFCNILFLG